MAKAYSRETVSEGAYGVFSRKSLWAQMGLARTSASVPDITPLGASFALEKAGNAALEGNYSEALLDAFGAIPGERLAASGLKGTGKAAKQWGEKLSISLGRPGDLAEAGEALIHGVDAETLRRHKGLLALHFNQSRGQARIGQCNARGNACQRSGASQICGSCSRMGGIKKLSQDLFWSER